MADILEHTRGHLVDPKSSKFLSQKVLTKATFRIGFYCLEKKFSRIFLISRIYTIYKYSFEEKTYFCGLDCEAASPMGSLIESGRETISDFVSNSSKSFLLFALSISLYALSNSLS